MALNPNPRESESFTPSIPGPPVYLLSLDGCQQNSLLQEIPQVRYLGCFLHCHPEQDHTAELQGRLWAPLFDQSRIVDDWSRQVVEL